MEMINDILREMRDRNEVRKVRLRQYGGVHCNCSIMPDDLPKEYADRIEKAYRREKEDNSKMKKVVDALNNCDGVKRCIEKGCESCRHNGHDCNSHDVVKALLEYRREDK